MKVQFDDLNLVESKMLLDILTAFRANQPFSWFPPNSQPRLVPPTKDDSIK